MNRQLQRARDWAVVPEAKEARQEDIVKELGYVHGEEVEMDAPELRPLI